MNKEIALFDFDGTITSKDTMLVFLRHLAGANRYHTSMLALSPVFAALTLGLISNQRAKEILLTRFIGGMEERSLVEACKEFTANILPGIIRPKAMECIREHQQRGTEVVVVSAAPHYWVSGWCLEHDIALLATHLPPQQREAIMDRALEQAAAAEAWGLLGNPQEQDKAEKRYQNGLQRLMKQTERQGPAQQIIRRPPQPGDYLASIPRVTPSS
jgi:HAD superfamily phosphoserine phosphatase-like hydrolase